MVTVGKMANADLKRATERYAGMVKGEWRVRLAPVRSSNRKAPGLVRREEGEALLKSAAGHDPVIALDEGGEKMDSRVFTSFLSKLKDTGKRPAFLVGGAFGIHESTLEASDGRISLSPMTLPHELAAVVLTEQIYRAYTQYAGRPYSK